MYENDFQHLSEDQHDSIILLSSQTASSVPILLIKAFIRASKIAKAFHIHNQHPAPRERTDRDQADAWVMVLLREAESFGSIQEDCWDSTVLFLKKHGGRNLKHIQKSVSTLAESLSSAFQENTGRCLTGCSQGPQYQKKTQVNLIFHIYTSKQKLSRWRHKQDLKTKQVCFVEYWKITVPRAVWRICRSLLPPEFAFIWVFRWLEKVLEKVSIYVRDF